LIGLGLGKQQMADGLPPHANATPGKTAAVTQTAAASNKISCACYWTLDSRIGEGEEEE